MSHTYNENSQHIIFSTKYRKPILTPEIQEELFPYIATIINQHFGQCYLINGMPDHLHILCQLSGKHGISDLVKRIKIESSKWLQNRFQFSPKFHWQTGYASFAVSHSQYPKVLKYIKNQEEHHRQQDFKDEYRHFIEKHGLKLQDDEFDN